MTSDMFINSNQEFKTGKCESPESRYKSKTLIFDKHNLGICAITQTRLTGFDKVKLEDEKKKLIHKGRNQAVGLSMSKQSTYVQNLSINWLPFTKYKSTHENVAICYAPMHEISADKINFIATSRGSWKQQSVICRCIWEISI